MDTTQIIVTAIHSFVLMLVLVTGFAYMTWLERKGAGRFQSRYGPNRAGPFGLFQPIADAIKLFFKEVVMPSGADKVLFILSPVIVSVPVLMLFAVVPMGGTVPFPLVPGGQLNLTLTPDLNVGVLYILAIASISVYGIILGGWSSNSKYATLGGLRSTAQMISYELALGLSMIPSVMLAGSLSLDDIVDSQRGLWYVVLQPVAALVFLMATLAETNRTPFDTVEAEQELTGSYHTEYSGMWFAMFFLTEYVKMIAVSAMMATLFLGGYREFWFLQNTPLGVDASPWLGPLYFFAKVVALLILMVWLRATLPRLRYDRLMAFGWKILLPVSLANIMLTAAAILLQPWERLF